MTLSPRPSGSGPRFGILGPLCVEVDGAEVPLVSAKQRGLLGTLLIDVGSVVATDRLAELLWGDDQPEDPAGAVQTHVSRLREALRRRGGAPAGDLLVTRSGGYALAVEPDRVDARRFERLLVDARVASSPQASAELAGEALGLWRGRPLPELDHGRATAEAARLEELRWEVLELRADALLRLGRHQHVVAELEVPIADDPLRERLRGLLMLALYRSGRQADALAAYRDLRATLLTELGIEPSAALRDLERAILQQDDQLAWRAPSAGGAVPSPGDTPQDSPGDTPQDSPGDTPQERTPLPEELTTLVGREADIRGVMAAVRTTRLVVLTGVGGVGKSRLAGRVARELAEDYADGVVFCDLVSATNPRAVPDVIATAAGVLPAARGSVPSLIELLRGQRLLLVVDNCEHVLGAASELVHRVRERCPGVHVLATSRQPLDVAGGQIWPVAPLDVVDGGGGSAVALFCDRAASADPTVEWIRTDREAVGEVCRRLDGLPLAIELAAARTRSSTPADIARRLDRRFDVLAGDSAAVPPRHRSLQAALDWSYDLLPLPARQLFDRLAVFAGGFSVDAAGQVCGGGSVSRGAVAGLVAGLVDHSLVAVDRSGRHARYRLLESLRSYGEAHLEARGELGTWMRRHAEHCASVAEQAAAGLRGRDEARWVQLLDTEFANLRVAQHRACASGQVDVALRLPGLLCDYAYYRLRDEVYRWAERALELPGASAHPGHPAAVLTAAIGRMQRGDLDRAVRDGAQVLAATTDPTLALRATQLLAETALYQGRLDEVDRRGRELLDRARAVADAYFEALGHLYRVHAAAYRGRPEAARAHLDAGWQVVARVGTPSLRAGFSYLEGESRLDAEPEVALAALHQAIETGSSVRNRFLTGVARVAAVSLQSRHGHPDVALPAFGEVVDHWRSCGDRVHLWTTLRNLLVLLERIGDHEAAAVLHGGLQTAATGAPPFGADAERMADSAAALRTSLGEVAFAAAGARGRCMSDEDVIAFARDRIDRLLAGATPSGRG